MSADLLAAFGNEKTDVDDTGIVKNSSEVHGVVPRPQQWQHQDARLDQPEGPLWQKDHNGKEVLFDASNSSENDEDEFGDFENPQHAIVLRQSTDKNDEISADLLGFDDLPLQSHQIPEAQASFTRSESVTEDPFDVFKEVPPISNALIKSSTESNGFEDDWGAFEAAAQPQTSKSIAKSRFPSSAVKPQHVDTTTFDEEPWDAFEDGPSSTPESRETMTNIKPQVVEDWAGDNAKGSNLDVEGPMTKDRPTNIPPPFSLLQLLTPAVQRLSLRCKATISGTDLSLLADRIVSLYRTTSRIIAGRQHRWKRDTILAQSMRISQVNHKTTGMKLTSLDRSESIKEDQEAIEAVAAWIKYNHILNPILLKAKVQKPAMSLSADLKNRAMTGPGIINEREPCAICGLKRNERVVGVDVKIDDIFEEFWIEHWGHAECRIFWFENLDLLTQR